MTKERWAFLQGMLFMFMLLAPLLFDSFPFR